MTLKQLQQIMGLHNFACNVVISTGLTKPYRYVRISSEARKDLQTWKLFLSAFNGKAFFQYDPWIPAEFLHLFTYAAESGGYGAIFGSHCFFVNGRQHGKLNQSPSSSCFPLWLTYIFGHHNCAINILSFILARLWNM